MKRLLLRKIWYTTITFTIFTNSFYSQEKYFVERFTESAFAKNLLDFSMNEITAKVPHLKSINLSFDLAEWYWTSNTSSFFATTSINVDIGKVEYVDFIMVLPDGSERRVSFKEIGIFETSNPTICDIKLEVQMPRVDMKGTVEIDLRPDGIGTGSVNFSQPSAAFREIVKFNTSLGRYKTLPEIMDELEPQVILTYRGSYNCDISDFESNFYLKAIKRYIEKEYAEASLEIKLTNLLAEAQIAATFNRIDEAIEKYSEALKLKQDPDIKAKIDELITIKNNKGAQELFEQAKREESLGNLEAAERLYKQSFEKSKDPNIQKEIDRISSALADQEREGHEQTTSAEPIESNGNYSNKSSSDRPVQRDVFGNPISNSTSNSASPQAQTNPTEDYNAIRKREIDNYNAKILSEAQNIANRDIEAEMKQSLSKIDKGVYANPQAMMKAGMNLMNAATSASDVYTGAALSGVGIVTGILEGAAKAKAAKEANEERERQRKLAEAREREIRQAFKSARLSLFSHFKNGELPLTGTSSMTQNLYYFVYAYKESELQQNQANVTLTNVFAIGKYPDGTWPMKTRIIEQINALTPLNEILVGPFQTLYEANLNHDLFTQNMNKVSLVANLITIEGFNPHPEDELTSSSSPKIDFWGNSIENNTNTKEVIKSEPANKVELDYWGNPIKNKAND